MWEDVWRHNVTIASDHPNHQDVDWVFAFHHSWYILWRHTNPTVVLWVHHLIFVEIFLIWEKPRHVWFEGCFSSLKSFVSRCLLLSLITCDKNWFFLIFYEKYQMSSCTTRLIRNSNTTMSLAVDLIDFQGSLLIMVRIIPTIAGFLLLEQSELGFRASTHS